MTSPCLQTLFYHSSSAAMLSDTATSSQGCGVLACRQQSLHTCRMANRKHIPCTTSHAAGGPLARLLSFTALTFTGRHRFSYAPLPVGLAPDDPLACVVVARVTDEHELGVVVVLDLVGQPPPTVLNCDAVDVGTGDS